MVGGCGGGSGMWIAGAGRGLGARLIAKWTVYPSRGYRTIRNEKPRMGVRGGSGGGLEEGMDGLLGGYFSEQGSEG